MSRSGPVHGLAELLNPVSATLKCLQPFQFIMFDDAYYRRLDGLIITLLMGFPVDAPAQSTAPRSPDGAVPILPSPAWPKPACLLVCHYPGRTFFSYLVSPPRGLMPGSFVTILGENKTITNSPPAPIRLPQSLLASSRAPHTPSDPIPSPCTASDKLQSPAEERIHGIREKHSWQCASSADTIRANNVGLDVFYAGVFPAEELC